MVQKARFLTIFLFKWTFSQSDSKNNLSLVTTREPDEKHNLNIFMNQLGDILASLNG